MKNINGVTIVIDNYGGSMIRTLVHFWKCHRLSTVVDTIRGHMGGPQWGIPISSTNLPFNIK